MASWTCSTLSPGSHALRTQLSTAQRSLRPHSTPKSQAYPRQAWASSRRWGRAGGSTRRERLPGDPRVLGTGSCPRIGSRRGPWTCWSWDWPSPGTVTEWWCSVLPKWVKPTSWGGSWGTNLKRTTSPQQRTSTGSCSTSEEKLTRWICWTQRVSGTSLRSGGCPSWQVRETERFGAEFDIHVCNNHEIMRIMTLNFVIKCSCCLSSRWHLPARLQSGWQKLFRWSLRAARRDQSCQSAVTQTQTSRESSGCDLRE